MLVRPVLPRVKVRLGLSLTFLIAVGTLTAVAQTWNKGDVFAGIANGQYNVYTNGGVLKQTLTDPSHSGYTTGCGFTKDFSKLYTTNFSNDVVEVYDGTGTTHSLLKTIDTSSAGDSNEDIVFDQVGNYYVGHADGTHGLLKFSPSDTILTTSFPDIQNRGTDWFDLATDQKTLYYASEGSQIKRFDVSANAQLTDFASLPNESYALRLLPPFDGSGGLLVANVNNIYKLDKTGSIAQTYTAQGAVFWFALNLDPNGTSFWSGDMGTGKLYRFNIATGAIEVGPIDTTSATGGQLNGICVRDEVVGAVDTTPPVVSLSKIVTGPPKQVDIASYDTQSGLKSIVVNSCNNCTAKTGTFTRGTNGIITTTATKTDQSKSSSVKLTVSDVAGNVTVYDPVDLQLEVEGRPTKHSVLLDGSESILLIANGMLGLSRIELEIDSVTVPAITLHNGEQERVDLRKYLVPGVKNRVRITATGAFHASAWLVFTQP